MRWAIFGATCIISVNIVSAQKQLFMQGIDGGNAINVASDKIEKCFTPPPFEFSQLKSLPEQKSDIDVTFINFPQNAETAFLYAVSIWESILSSPVTIHIIARWDSLDNSIVSESRPALNFRTFEAAPVADVYYPVALVEKLLAEEVNPGKSDIICNFNENMPWYFGTDGNTPSTSYDFVTSVLHDIAHGLGFYGFFKDENGMGYLDNANNLPSIYDYLVFNDLNQQISNKVLFESPSVELHEQLTSNKLKLNHTNIVSDDRETLDWIYSPDEWVDGSSIYHFKESTNRNQLMSFEIKKGEAIHHPGETTLKVLSEIGWESVSFIFEELKDFETPREKLPVSVGISSELPLNLSSFKIIFSIDNFSTADTVWFSYNSANNNFFGELPLDSHEGFVHYYFEVNSTDNRIFRFPSIAPQKKLSFRVGPDYYPPEIFHNAKKFIEKSASNFDLIAVVTDNTGVSEVKAEMKIDGKIKEIPLNSIRPGQDYFSGKISVSDEFGDASIVEYRLVAKDESTLGNYSTSPANGFYKVEIFEALGAAESYQNSFNSATGDFVLSDFLVSKPTGFNDGNLHTENPYHTSDIESEYYNHYAILKYPVILKKGGLMQFDEIVLVEPAEVGTSYTDKYFWDYVIVEGSKDYGKTWLPITKGYDSNIFEEWSSVFFESFVTDSLILNSEIKEMYRKHKINIIEESAFKEGDIVIFRFRLSSDKSVNGWGWAIDNLEIQQTYTGSDKLAENKNITIIPNPFVNTINIDFGTGYSAAKNIEIRIIDLTGKVVYNESWKKQSVKGIKEIDLSGLARGIYVVDIDNYNSNRLVQKIVKK
ncbi:T9SS type A sorting domain-containing protein [Maribellus comscasis]|uniref:T9SS type A sorting domain-containing protein n=1 Tax=Maribellus comscasis TaxID=2681766 RepID=A0A6I6JVA5_9BACT|nr:T9SS type A sorting domain-containing protein [Maribellus comscasis]QGY44092.1 T9SS type A sorting domain-containing protein [Maribellus comscasis]